MNRNPYRVNSGGIYVCAPQWSMHYNDCGQVHDFDIWAVFGGRGWLSSVEHGQFMLSGGDVFVFRPWEKVNSTHDPEHPLEVVAVHFDFLDDSGQVETAEQLPPFYCRVSQPQLLRMLMCRCVTAHQDKQTADADVWLQAVMTELQWQQRRQPCSDSNAGEQVQQIEALCERIRCEPQYPWSVEELAARLHVSTDHFTRIFRRVRQMTPREYIARQRVLHAQTLLLESRFTVSQIAGQLGYGSVQHFSSHFRRHSGMAPSQYRYGRQSCRHDDGVDRPSDTADFLDSVTPDFVTS